MKKRKKKIIIKVGNWYRIKFNGYHNGEYIGKYEGIGQCTNELDFGVATFDKLEPKAGSLNSGSYAIEDIVEELE